MKNYPKKVTMTVAFEVIHVSPKPISRADALRKAEELGGRFPTQIEALVISEQYPETIKDNDTPVPFYTRDTRAFYEWASEEYKGFGYCYPAIRAVGAYEQNTIGSVGDMYAVIVKSL